MSSLINLTYRQIHWIILSIIITLPINSFAQTSFYQFRVGTGLENRKKYSLTLGVDLKPIKYKRFTYSFDANTYVTNAIGYATSYAGTSQQTTNTSFVERRNRVVSLTAKWHPFTIKKQKQSLLYLGAGFCYNDFAYNKDMHSKGPGLRVVAGFHYLFFNKLIIGFIIDNNKFIDFEKRRKYDFKYIHGDIHLDVFIGLRLKGRGKADTHPNNAQDQ